MELVCMLDTFISFWSIPSKTNWFYDIGKQRRIWNKVHLHLRSRIWQCCHT